MADAGGANVPGAYFIGRPANAAERQQPAAAATEPTPAHTQTPGDYFIGTPKNSRPQAVEPEPARPAGDLKRSKSCLEWFSCLRDGQIAN